MTPDELRTKKRLFSAAMLAGDFETAELLAIEIEPYTTPIEDDREPLPIPVWGCES
jgi:hypothetical protein